LIGTGPTVAIAMGVITATFGGILRDLLGAESPVVLSREIYVTAALAGAASFVAGSAVGLPREVAVFVGLLIGFGLRGACENSNSRRARRNILEKLRVLRTDNAADIRLDAMSENCVFYISPMYEFSHSLDPEQTSRRPASRAGRSAMCLLRLCVFELNNACYSTRPYNEGRRFQ